MSMGWIGADYGLAKPMAQKAAASVKRRAPYMVKWLAEQVERARLDLEKAQSFSRRTAEGQLKDPSAEGDSSYYRLVKKLAWWQSRLPKNEE